MMERIDHIRLLFSRHLDGTLDPAGEEELYAFMESVDREGVLDALEPLVEATPMDERFDVAEWETAILRILRTRRARVHYIWRAAAAAAIILCLVTGAWIWYTGKQHHHAGGRLVSIQQDIQPGGNKAVLTLSGGRHIVLDSAGNGQLAMQGDVVIRKTGNGMLTYVSPGNTAGGAMYNTLSTPRGGQYQLTLPDGTKVWLDAASSITYPTTFTGKDRSVSITGEAYFEVANDAARPFRVHAAGSDVEVLGTAFNINAYADEGAARTSLLQGSVKVNAQLLRPGQAYKDGHVFAAEVEKDIAWKNGLFNFNGADLAAVMRQLSRWYDIEVVYTSHIPDIRFGGDINRNLNLSEVLRFLESLGVHFILENRKLSIMP